METASTPCKVHQCCKCPGDTEYYCVSCPCDLCPQCKENHVKDLQTIDHDVVSYRDKINYIPTQEICVRHPSHVYTKYCEPCQVPVCYHCRKHRKHRQLVVRIAYRTKRQQHRETIHTIRGEALFHRPVLLPRIKTDFKTCRTEFSLYQSEMLTKAQTLKNLIDYMQKDFTCNVFCDFDFKHRCLKQQKEMIIHIVCLQRYVYIYEQRRVIRPLQFLSSIKTALPQIHPTLHTSQFSMTESLNKEDVMESLSAIQITERGNRRVGNQWLLKLTSAPELHQSLTVTDTTGVPLHRVKDSCRGDRWGRELYGRPDYITENNNGDVVVSDFWYDVVVTERGGRHRFFYRGPPGSELQPHGIYQSCVMESLSGIPTPGTEKPQQGNQCLLKLMSPPELLHSLTTQQVSLYIV
nr:uncharacterized protein LOC105324216 [Crassostrea gigas]